MQSKIISLFSVLIILCTFGFSVSAESGSAHLVDNADLLSDSEQVDLASKLDDISVRQNMDVVVVTVTGTNGLSMQAYADDFFDYNGYGKDGVLLLVDITSRNWHISTTGYGITAFTDAGIDCMSEKFLPDMKSSNWYDAFSIYAEQCDDFIGQARSGHPYDTKSLSRGSYPWFRAIFFSIIGGLVVAFVVTFGMKRQLKTVRSEPYASSYVCDGSLNIRDSQDWFEYSNVVKHPRQSSNSGGGGSSTHRSSSGTSHGGKGGSF